MSKADRSSTTVLTIRVPHTLERRLRNEARRRRRSRSETARALLEAALGGLPDVDPATEARRQSMLASRRRSERDVLRFTSSAADLRGWK